MNCSAAGILDSAHNQKKSNPSKKQPDPRLPGALELSNVTAIGTLARELGEKMPLE